MSPRTTRIANALNHHHTDRMPSGMRTVAATTTSVERMPPTREIATHGTESMGTTSSARQASRPTASPATQAGRHGCFTLPPSLQG